MKIYTKRGDDGTTALFNGDRVRKDALVIELNGAIDEAQAALGMARAECEQGDELDELLMSIERDLWIVMADIATPRDDGATLLAGEVTSDMVQVLEGAIDSMFERFTPPHNFAVPGGGRLSAALDYARTIVRRAERLAVADGRTGQVVAYLNRLSDLCWVLARYSEDEHIVNTRWEIGVFRHETHTAVGSIHVEFAVNDVARAPITLERSPE